MNQFDSRHSVGRTDALNGPECNSIGCANRCFEASCVSDRLEQLRAMKRQTARRRFRKSPNSVDDSDRSRYEEF